MKRIIILLGSVALLVCCAASRTLSSGNRDDEMNVVYGTVDRNSNALTVSEVSVSEAEEQVYSDIFSYLRNKVPGVEVGNTSGAGQRPHIQIRGNRSLLGDEGEPLFLVDGVEYSQIETIRPDEIHSVQVFKDSGASSFGSRGANGVISITTKVAHEAAERERALRKAERQQLRGK